MAFRVVNGKYVAVQELITPKTIDKQQVAAGNKFDDLLKKEINKNEGFVFSNHATERLRDRNIKFNEADMKKINEGINIAKEKGAKESLILYKNIALVTSIPNRTVITAMDKNIDKDMVITNIDSVVLL